MWTDGDDIWAEVRLKAEIFSTQDFTDEKGNKSRGMAMIYSNFSRSIHRHAMLWYIVHNPKEEKCLIYIAVRSEMPELLLSKRPRLSFAQFLV